MCIIKPTKARTSAVADQPIQHNTKNDKPLLSKNTLLFIDALIATELPLPLVKRLAEIFCNYELRMTMLISYLTIHPHPTIDEVINTAAHIYNEHRSISKSPFDIGLPPR